MLSKYIYDDPASKELEVDSFSITQVMQYALVYDPLHIYHTNSCTVLCI